MAEVEYTSGSAARPRVRTVPELVVVGAASRDVTADDPRGWRLGGGVTYCALTAARLGIRTAALVGVDGLAARASELDLLRAAGAEVVLVRLPHGPVFENVEHPGGRLQTCLDPGHPVPVTALPVAWRSAPGWILAPVAREVPEAWAAVPPADAFVALGWQGLLRVLRAGDHVRRLPPAASPLLERADLVGVSRHDLDPATPFADLTTPLHSGAELIVTAGEDGGYLVAVAARRPARIVRYPPLRADAEVDPVGAGDTFLAGVVAARLALARRGKVPAPRGGDLRLAAAGASLVVEREGLLGVPTLSELACRLARSP